jgi:hypothetical protein
MGTGTGPHTIYLKTRSRQINQPPGQIEAFIAGRTDVISYETGKEFRNDVTSGVLIGGDIEQITPLNDDGTGTTIHPYWGLQSYNPIEIPFGTTGNQPLNASEMDHHRLCLQQIRRPLLSTRISIKIRHNLPCWKDFIVLYEGRLKNLWDGSSW